MSALTAAKETGRGVPSVIAAACLAQASASSLPVIPWWPGIQSSVVFPARLFSMRLRSVGGAAPDRLKKQLAVRADGHGCM